MPKKQPGANQLIRKKSTFLKQHTYNPIHWYPWGNEAFEKAKTENKPIFLSIGYSTNHVCHVINRESFEDREIAAFLNEHYVSILVDQDERPDIASLYTSVCHMMTGQRGVPLSIFMTPDQIPYYAGTYFPRESKYYMPGIMDVLTNMLQEYHENPEHMKTISKNVIDAIKNAVPERGPKRLSSKYTIKAYQLLHDRFDAAYGGFGAAPKYPFPQHILFLLRFYRLTGKKDALTTAEHTLKAMADGGIYDHLGFGFHHCATDTKWLVPHFEKLLSDNALLLIAYTECFQITKKPFYKNIGEQLITFVKRELHSSVGAFYSAIDADSEGMEGNYYVWDVAEIHSLLGENLGNLFTKTYNITPKGNFREKSIPNLIRSDLEAVAEEFHMTTDELREQLEEARGKLRVAREKRIHPQVDTKILTAWNAMMITALAKAGRAFQKPDYTKIAEDTMTFMEDNLMEKERVMSYFSENNAKCSGCLHDYAYLLWAYIELYNTTLSLPYLKKAQKLADSMIDLFWDHEHGGFFYTGHDSEKLFARQKEILDSTLPSGNSIVAIALVQLGYLTGEAAYLDKVEDMYHTFHMEVIQNPATTTAFMQSLLLTELPVKQVIMIGNNPDFTNKLQQEFSPDVSLLACESPSELDNIAPFVAECEKLDGETTFYVSENFTCDHPTTDPDEAWKWIKKK